MSVGELSAFVCSHLRKHGIAAVLSGGACVAIYTDNRYQSLDLDFIENVPVGGRRLKDVLAEVGFVEKGRFFVHPDTDFFLDFPAGPLAVGSEPVQKIHEMAFPTGRLALLSPTDCVKDRLAAFYHWNDRQCLEQALLVAAMRTVNLKEIEKWSAVENKSAEFQSVRDEFVRAQRGRRRP